MVNISISKSWLLDFCCCYVPCPSANVGDGEGEREEDRDLTVKDLAFILHRSIPQTTQKGEAESIRRFGSKRKIFFTLEI